MNVMPPAQRNSFRIGSTLSRALAVKGVMYFGRGAANRYQE